MEENKRIMITIKKPYSDNGLKYIDDIIFDKVLKSLDKAFEKYVKNIKVYDMRD